MSADRHRTARMHWATARALMRFAGPAAAGTALLCWGPALAGYWPVAFALYGQRALLVAGTTLAFGVLLAAAGGAFLSVALVVALRGRPGNGEVGL